MSAFDSVMVGYLSGRVPVRAHDIHPGMVTSLAPASTMPAPASGGLGGQQDVGRFGAPSQTVPAATAPPSMRVTEEWERQHAIEGQHDPDSYPVAWQGQRYAAYQDAPAPDLNGRASISDVLFFAGGEPPLRIARLNKRYLSLWQGIQQWGMPQSNMRLNMRPGSGQLAGNHPTRGPRSVSGVQDVLVQGSGTRRIPAVFVPTSVY